VPVQIVPVKDELFSRFGGLLETDVFANKRVFIAGQGSGGSFISIELASSGFMYFYLMDHDRLWIGNVVRHVAGISYVGRYKTKAMAQLIKDKNPYAKVYTWEERISWDNVETVRNIVKESDLIVCATDNRPSKLILNRVCVEENKPCIFAGAFRRAYGGQILFVKPNNSLCYQCFLMHLPEQAEDEEISNPEHAEELAYTDRPVPIEPGLSNDIKPISVMVVKLIIQELLKGTETTLRSLDEDLVAPWYLWLNRREINSQYESLEPLEFNVDGMHVLRWYGIAIERHPGCPVCGNFERYQVEAKCHKVPIFPNLE
jgi:molybdopterin/thiamine biosynthesis adenylyltransferase